MKLNKKILIGSILAGLVSSALVALLYNLLVDVCGRSLLIALLFVVFSVIVCATLFVIMLVTGESDEEFLFLRGKGLILAGLAGALVILFGVSMLLEFIYDRDKQVMQTPSAYVFLLDESGSMESNDSNLERYNAVNMLMETMPTDFPYAVYMFANRTVCVREMAPASQEQFQADQNIANSIGASTMIKDGLQTILDDVQSGKLLHTGGALRVILLTDGVASDMSSFLGSGEIIRAYRKENISISAVGLGHVDEQLLTNLANKTGGVYVPIENAGQLGQGFISASAMNSGRNLLSVRNMSSMNWLYMLLRVLFLLFLGAIVAVMKSIACAKEEDTKLIILVGAIASLLGGLLLEILTQAGVTVWVGQAIYFFLLAVTPVRIVERRSDFGNIPLYY